jgi:hypothetical protein
MSCDLTSKCGAGFCCPHRPTFIASGDRHLVSSPGPGVGSEVSCDLDSKRGVSNRGSQSQALCPWLLWPAMSSTTPHHDCPVWLATLVAQLAWFPDVRVVSGRAGTTCVSGAAPWIVALGFLDFCTSKRTDESEHHMPPVHSPQRATSLLHISSLACILNLLDR